MGRNEDLLHVVDVLSVCGTDLLEHVMETNGSYYWVSKQYRMPLYMLYNLDVTALLLLPVVALFLVVFAVCRQCTASRSTKQVKKAKSA
jgi:hypothetical protein